MNLGSSCGGGELSVWEFSGHDNYYMLYDHFIGNSNCIHVVMFSLAETPSNQLAQVADKNLDKRNIRITLTCVR